MARAKSTAERGLKTRLIREGIDNNPDLKPKALAEKLTNDNPGVGIEFRSIDVSLVKHQRKVKAEAGMTTTTRVASPRASRTSSPTSATSGLGLTDVQTLAELATRAGGITPLMEMLEAIKGFAENEK